MTIESLESLAAKIPIALSFGHCADLEEARALLAATSTPEAWVARRRDSFALGRAAAIRALAALGEAPAILPYRIEGPPAWPPGTTGSISHTDAEAIAVVARTGAVAGLGIDFERRDAAAEPDALKLAVKPGEIARLGGGAPILALFCAKEAAYKAMSAVLDPSTGFWDLDLDATSSGFRASAPGEAVHCDVWWDVVGRHVVAIAVRS